MSYLGSHPNLVALVGAVTRDIKNGEAYLIFELCSNGNAHKFVRDRRDNFVDMFAAQASSNMPGLKSTYRYGANQFHKLVAKSRSGCIFCAYKSLISSSMKVVENEQALQHSASQCRFDHERSCKVVS